MEDQRPSSFSRYCSDARQNYSRSVYSGKGILHHEHEEKKSSDARPASKPAWVDKFNTLKAQRKARGEWFRCGDKYHPGHKCNKSVPLNLVEELMEILEISSSDSEVEENQSSNEEDNMHISECAMAGSTQKKSMRLQGTINGKQVLILVDSGSHGNFISSKAVKFL